MGGEGAGLVGPFGRGGSVPESRIEELTPCEHCKGAAWHMAQVHGGDNRWEPTGLCPGSGGSRRVLEVVEPDYDAVTDLVRDEGMIDLTLVNLIVDAALAGGRIVRETTMMQSKMDRRPGEETVEL